MRHLLTVLGCLSVIAGFAAHAASDQVQDLKREIENLRKEINSSDVNKSATPIGKVDARTSMKYGPNNVVETKVGKLSIGGLVQVWYQSVANDRLGLNRLTEVGEGGETFEGESSDTFDNDTFRIRRTELRLTMDVHENVSAYIMIDPARESNIQFYQLPTLYVRNSPLSNSSFLQSGAGLQAGNTIVPQLLQDCYINFHDVVPYHDFTIGQFKPPSGEEAWRNSGQLEFVERAMVTGLNNVRDIGAMVHGSFLEGRVQYWAGVFNGPFGTVLSNPELVEGGNRSDDNDEKDFAWRVQFRPVWNKDKWHGRLELGYSRTDGLHGEGYSEAGRDTPVNGLNVEKTWINRNAAWAWYRPGGPVAGWWLRGEWGSSKDRFYNQGIAVGPTIWFEPQNKPKAETLAGWYFGTGYKLSDSIWAEGLENGGGVGGFLKNLEFAFRYEVFDAVVVESSSTPDRNSDIYKTQTVTAGINYYIKGHDAKIQANYIWVDEPEIDNGRGFREIRNDVFVVNFQVMF